MDQYISAIEAATRLGVKPATLYAYVSRGQIRSEPVPGSRSARYLAEDVDRLLANRGTGAGAGLIKSYDAHTPVLESALCLIRDGRVHYRGQDAVTLSETATLEDIARLLWDDEAGYGFAPGNVWTPEERLLPRRGAVLGLELIARAQSLLALAGFQDLKAIDTSTDGLILAGGRIVRLLTALGTGRLPDAAPIHRQIAAAARLDATGADLVRRCLVLSADHELNASTFALRCVASTRATLHAALVAGLASFSGPRHGAMSLRVDALLAEAAATGEPERLATERLRLGEAIAGFGHPLYPAGDPRAVALMQAGRDTWGRGNAAFGRAERLGRRVTELTGEHPNIDFALSALASGLGLPAGAASALFLTGRSVGWIAHAIEQYATPDIIRPRARYVGVAPAD